MDLNRSMIELLTVLEANEYAPTYEPIDEGNNMPPWVHTAWIILFTIMMCVAVCGNIIVIWTVIAHRRMRTVTNYFLVNLSIADMLMASLNCLFNFIYMLRNDWIFGSWYCKLNNFLANVTVAASVFTLIGISYDRYQAIVQPMRPRMTKTCSLIIIVGIWASGMILAMPCLVYSSTQPFAYKGINKTACLLTWPDGLPDVSDMDFSYQMVFFIVTYLLPMLAMSYFYTEMGKVLWGSSSIGELTQRQMDSIRSKRKVVTLFMFLIMSFGVCWLPYHMYFIVSHVYPKLMYKPNIKHIYLGFYWLAMANSMVNPIIYYGMNAKLSSFFRLGNACRWARCCCCRRLRHLPESPQDCVSQSGGGRSRSARVSTGIEELKERSAARHLPRQEYRTQYPLHSQHLQRHHLYANAGVKYLVPVRL